MAVQHKVAVPAYCELTPRPPARSPPLSHAETACRDLSLFFFSIDIVNDVVLSNHFIHSSASLATLRYAKKTHRYRYRYSVPYPLPSLRVYNKKHHRLLARSLASKNPHQNHKKPSPLTRYMYLRTHKRAATPPWHKRNYTHRYIWLQSHHRTKPY